MDLPRRRDLLRWLGLTGTLGLAGCQDSTDDTTPTTATQAPTESTTTTSPPTESTTTTPLEIDARVATKASAESSSLHLTGEVRAAPGINSVHITAGDVETTLSAAGAETYPLDISLQVEGGETYIVVVTATTTDGRTKIEVVDTGYVPRPAAGVPVDRLVGVHYYHWWEMHGGHQNWTERTVSDPVLGEYAADDPAIIDQHLTWCLEHGIRWLSMSWWGPTAPSDSVLRNEISDAEKFDEFEFSILYEKNRLREFDYDLDTPWARSRLIDDLQYLEATYFTRDNYLHIDGRPVLYFYIAQRFTGDVQAAFDEITDQLDTPPYIIADLPFGTPASNYPIAQVADAVSTYNPYSPREDIEAVFHDQYAQGNKVLQLGADAMDLDYVPVVVPGYNDTALPDDVRVDNPVLEATPTRYQRVCEQVHPHLAESTAVLVTSFNEWYENTQIEPSEEYGTAYLDITERRLATGTSRGFTPDGDRLSLAFNKTIVPTDVTDSTDHRALAFMATRLVLYEGDELIADYDIGGSGDEPLFIEGVHGRAEHDGMTWRWLGGATTQTTLLLEAARTPDRAILYGQPMRSNEITADISLNGVQTDHVAFDERAGRADRYELSLVE